jgi:hypothetical protein
MASQSQKPVRVGFVKQQQSEQPRRTPSLEKSSSIRFFEGWNAGSLSLPSGPGLQPPHPSSPQPSPKTQLTQSNPFEERRPLRLGERPQGSLRLPKHTLADESFFAIPKNNQEGTPAIEYAATHIVSLEHIRLTILRLHPAQHDLSSTAAASTPASSSSDKWSSSEASSFAHVIQRERISKKNFRKTMVTPRHLSLAPSSRPAPPRTIVSSPAIVMQSAPPSPGFQPPVKSMTFSDALTKPRNTSPNRQSAAHPHISFANSKLKNRRAKASLAPKHSVGTSLHMTSTNSPLRGPDRSVASQDPRPHINTQPKSSDSILTQGALERPGHPGNPVSFVSTIGSVVETADHEREEAPPPTISGDPPKQGFLRVLTVHSIVPGPIKREATKLLQSESPQRRQSKQPSIIPRSSSPGGHCFGLFSHRSRRRKSLTHASIQTTSTCKGTTIRRKDSYVGADGREYTHRPVAGLSFLPSEMQRVNTPPMGRANRSPGSRPKGFFFDYTSPPGDEAEIRRESVAGSSELGRVPSNP